MIGKEKQFKKFGLYPLAALKNAFNPEAIKAAFARFSNFYNNNFVRMPNGDMIRADVLRGGTFGMPGMGGYDTAQADLWYQQGGTVLRDGDQVVHQPLWHELTYTSASTTTLTFFQTVTIGTITGNMEQAGQIPNTERQLVTVMRFIPLIVTSYQTTAVAPAAVNDVAALILNGFLEFKVLAKSYLFEPLLAIPGGAGVWGYADIASTVATAIVSVANHGVPDPRAIYQMYNPVQLPGGISFRFISTWSAAQTLAAGNSTLMVFLDGQRVIPVQ